MMPLHISLITAHSGCKPSSSVSSFKHSLQVFLPLPTHLTPATSTFLQADTQSSTLLSFRCPNHHNLPNLTTSGTLWIPKRLYTFTLHYLSFNEIPHIHLTIIICPALSRLCRFSAFIAHVFKRLKYICIKTQKKALTWRWLLVCSTARAFLGSSNALLLLGSAWCLRSTRQCWVQI